MNYTNSKLVSYIHRSHQHSGKRNHKIDTITPHCAVGQAPARNICDYFASTSRDASCNYCIGSDGKIALCVDEENRSWCSSSSANDNRAVTIECASDTKPPYAMKAAVYKSLVELCVDICKRNGIRRLLWLGNKDKTLNYTPKAGEAVLSAHRWFADKSCPGDWLYSRYGKLAKDITEKLKPAKKPSEPVPAVKKMYRVQTGAFSRKTYADDMMEKVKNAGFPTYMVKVGGLYKVQVGAYKDIDNAEHQKKKLEEAGFSAFITTHSGAAVTKPKKSVSQIAEEVIAGKWGVGEDRKNRLKKAGYNPDEVQSRVNHLLE